MKRTRLKKTVMESGGLDELKDVELVVNEKHSTPICRRCGIVIQKEHIHNISYDDQSLIVNEFGNKENRYNEPKTERLLKHWQENFC